MRLLPVDSAVHVIANVMPLIDDLDFKTRRTDIAHNAAGMDLVWNLEQPDGTVTQTPVTPTSGGLYDWTHIGDGFYKVAIPATGGGDINNDTPGYGWFSGLCDGVLPWVGPTYAFVPEHVVNGLVAGSDKLQVDAVELNGSGGAVGNLTPANIAVAVWDESNLDHNEVSTFGWLLQTSLASLIASRSTPADVNAQVLALLNAEQLVAGVAITEALRRIGAITSGGVSGAGSGAETFQDYAGSAATIVITVDAAGNRTSITYN